MGEFRFDFELAHPGFDELQSPQESAPGQRTRFADELYLRFGLDRAEPVHEGSQAPEIVERVPAHGVGDEARFARLHFHNRPVMLIAVEVNVVRLANEPMEQAEKLGQPANVLDS